jgi:ABC-type Fe3+-siderophore transport system permease subunit
VNYRPGRIAILSIAVSLTLGSIIVFPFLGYAALGFADIWESTKPGADIFWHLRLPRVLIALLTGSALAAAGTVTQALLRNPLATPYTLGIASGSVFGAILGILTGWGTGIMLPFFAVAGAMAVLALLNGIVFFSSRYLYVLYHFNRDYHHAVADSRQPVYSVHCRFYPNPANVTLVAWGHSG